MSNNLDRFKVPRTKTMPLGRVDLARVDATTEAQIRQQKRSDTLEAKADAVAYVRGFRDTATRLKPVCVVATPAKPSPWAAQAKMIESLFVN